MRPEERILRVLALAAGYVLLIQAAVTAVEIVARKLFNHSFQGVDELGGYALAIAGAVGFGYAAVTCAHTRIDLVLAKLPLAGRAVLHQIAAIVLMVVAFGMFWYGLRSLRQSIEFGAISTTPSADPALDPPRPLGHRARALRAGDAHHGAALHRGCSRVATSRGSRR